MSDANDASVERGEPMILIRQSEYDEYQKFKRQQELKRVRDRRAQARYRERTRIKEEWQDGGD